MAGNTPGPDGKDPAKLTRRNAPAAPSKPTVALPAAGRAGRPPNLPPGVAVSDAVMELWREWWASPMATQWLRTDYHLLVRLAGLWDEFLTAGASEEGDPAKISAEMRQLEDRLGLSPTGRRTLGWVIVDDVAEEPPGDTRATRSRSRQRKDPRAAHLKAI